MISQQKMKIRFLCLYPAFKIIMTEKHEFDISKHNNRILSLKSMNQIFPTHAKNCE